MKKTAVVILNWNGEKLLETFLPSVVKFSQTRDTDIIVADNASTDNSIAVLQKKFPQVSLIQLDKNYGFAKGYNLALQQVEAKYYVLLNADIEVTENWIKPAIEMMEKDETIAVVQSKMRSFHQKEYFEYAGAGGGFIDKYGYTFCRGRIINRVEKDHGQYDDIKEVFWACGGVMFVRAHIFHRLGRFDDSFLMHMEEIDFCWRLKNSGYKIYYTPQSVVYHVGGGFLPYNNPFKLYLNFRNNLFMLHKNLHPRKLFLTILARLVMDGIAAGLFLLQLKFSSFLAVAKAHIAYYKAIRKLQNKRKNISPMIVKHHHPEIFNRSILISYFIKKKKIFSDLDF